MKIIDLLNKIAKGEEVPKKIKYEDDIYIHVDNYCYFCEETNEILSQNIYAEFSRLNDEVEVIEDNKKIQPIKTSCTEGEPMTLWTGAEIEIIEKVNEIIEVINNEY